MYMKQIISELWLSDDVPRQSTCELEVDAVAADVLNRLEVGDNVGSNPGLTALWEDEKQRRREKGESSQLEAPGSPDRGHIPWAPAENELQQRLADIVQELNQLDVAITPDDDANMTPSGDQGSLLYPATPASEVEVHLSQATSPGSSPSTLILDSDSDGDSDAEVIINERSILQVVSSSQSFWEVVDNLPVSQGSQDKSLAALLASLADDTADPNPALSQLSARVTALEESDSLLSPRSQDRGSLKRDSQKSLDRASQKAGSPGIFSDEASDDDEDESILMSQIVWGDDDEKSSASEEHEQPDSGSAVPEFDLQGMDTSWNSSQWIDIAMDTRATATGPTTVVAETDSSSGEELGDSIPQLDGPTDTREEVTTRRLGVSDPAKGIRKAGRSMILPLGSFKIRAQTIEQAKPNTRSYTKTLINGSLTRMPNPTKAPEYYSVGTASIGTNIRSPRSKLKMTLDMSKTRLVESPKAAVIDPPAEAPQEAAPAPVEEAVPSVPVRRPGLYKAKHGSEPQQKRRPPAKTYSVASNFQEVPKQKSGVHSVHPQNRGTATYSRLSKKKPQPTFEVVTSEENSATRHVPNVSSPSVVIRPGNVVRQMSSGQEPNESTSPAAKKTQSIDLRSVYTTVPMKQVKPSKPPVTKQKSKDWASAISGIDQVAKKVKRMPVYTQQTVADHQSAIMETMQYEQVTRQVMSNPKPNNKENHNQTRISETIEQGVDGVDVPEMSDQTQDKTKSSTEKSRGRMSPAKKTRRSPDKSRRSPSKSCRSPDKSKPTVSEDIQIEAEEMMAPDSDNIFTMLAQNLPEPTSNAEDKGNTLPQRASTTEKSLAETGAAKFAQRLIGFKKSLLKGSPKFQGKLTTATSKNTEQAISSDQAQLDAEHRKLAEDEPPDIQEVWASGEMDEQKQQLAQEWLEKNKIKVRRARRRRHSSKSSHAGSGKGNQTGSEREMSDRDIDPEDFIVTHRGSSDSSAPESDSDSIDLTVRVGCFQKTYEKPSYRVGSSYGTKANDPEGDRKFDEIFKRTSSLDDDDAGTEGDVEMETSDKTKQHKGSKLQNSKELENPKARRLSLNKSAKATKQPPVEKEQISTVEISPQKKNFVGLHMKPDQLPNKKSKSNRVLFTHTSPVKYKNGKVSMVGDYVHSEVISCVRVLRDDMEDHDFDQIGTEDIVLRKMDTSDVSELRAQVKKEMDHKRKEHIMPLIMQKSQDEIENEYAQVKKRVMEELAHDPPMAEYIDSDLETLEESDEVSNVDKESNKSVGGKPSKNRRKDEAVQSPEKSPMSSDDEMPILEPEYPIATEAIKNVSEPSKQVDLDESIEVIDIGEKHTDMVKKEASNEETEPEIEQVFYREEEDADENVTFVIMSKEEAEAESEKDDKSEDEMEVDNEDGTRSPLENKASVCSDDKQHPDKEELYHSRTESEREEHIDSSKEEDIVVIDLDAQARKMAEEKLARQEPHTESIAEDVVSTKSESKQESGSIKSFDAKSSIDGSRRSSIDKDKEDMAEVDFSLLEMDTDNEAAEGSLQDLDTHNQLHTPPMVIDSEQHEQVILTPQKDPPSEDEDQYEDDGMLTSVIGGEMPDAKEGRVGDRLEKESSPSAFCSYSATKERKRKTYEQSDHYRFRDKRVHADYSTGKYARVLSEGSRTSSASNSPTRKRSRTGLKKAPSEDRTSLLSSGDDDNYQRTRPSYIDHEKWAKLFPNIKPAKVVVEKLHMTGKTLNVKTSIHSTDEDVLAGYQGVLTDVASENQDDPLWEAQRQRLAERQQTSKRQKGPPTMPSVKLDVPKAAQGPPVKKATAKRKPKGPYVRRAKKRPDQKKFLDKLSLLHQYTLDSLKEDAPGQGVSEPGSGSSNTGSGNTSPRLQAKEPVSYNQQAGDDHNAEYDDVMYKLSLLSPPEPQVLDKSPPQPGSPTTSDDRECLGLSIVKEVARHESAGCSAIRRMAESNDVRGDAETHPSPDEEQRIGSSPARKESVPYAIKTEVVRFSSNGPSVTEGLLPVPENSFHSLSSTPPPDLGPPQCIINKAPVAPIASTTNISPPKLSSEPTFENESEIVQDSANQSDESEKLQQYTGIQERKEASVEASGDGDKNKTKDFVKSAYADFASWPAATESKCKEDEKSEATSVQAKEDRTFSSPSPNIDQAPEASLQEPMETETREIRNVEERPIELDSADNNVMPVIEKTQYDIDNSAPNTDKCAEGNLIPQNITGTSICESVPEEKSSNPSNAPSSENTTAEKTQDAMDPCIPNIEEVTEGMPAPQSRTELICESIPVEKSSNSSDLPSTENTTIEKTQYDIEMCSPSIDQYTEGISVPQNSTATSISSNPPTLLSTENTTTDSLEQSPVGANTASDLHSPIPSLGESKEIVVPGDRESHSSICSAQSKTLENVTFEVVSSSTDVLTDTKGSRSPANQFSQSCYGSAQSSSGYDAPAVEVTQSVMNAPTYPSALHPNSEKPKETEMQTGNFDTAPHLVHDISRDSLGRPNAFQTQTDLLPQRSTDSLSGLEAFAKSQSYTTAPVVPSTSVDQPIPHFTETYGAQQASNSNPTNQVSCVMSRPYNVMRSEEDPRSPSPQVLPTSCNQPTSNTSLLPPTSPVSAPSSPYNPSPHPSMLQKQTSPKYSALLCPLPRSSTPQQQHHSQPVSIEAPVSVQHRPGMIPSPMPQQSQHYMRPQLHEYQHEMTPAMPVQQNVSQGGQQSVAMSNPYPHQYSGQYQSHAHSSQQYNPSSQQPGYCEPQHSMSSPMIPQAPHLPSMQHGFRHPAMPSQSFNPQVGPCSPSPPHSPSPIQSPDPHRGLGPDHTPAVIPLNIEDPEIQEEVEKARRYKLLKILGQNPSSKQIQRMLLKEKLAPMAVHPSVGDRSTAGTSSGQQQANSGNYMNPAAIPASAYGQSGYGQHPGGNFQQTLGSGGGPGQSYQRVPETLQSSAPVILQPSMPPPTRHHIMHNAMTHQLGEYQAQEAYCSNPQDLPERPR